MLEKVRLQEYLKEIINTESDARYRPLAVLSAIIAVGDFEYTTEVMRILKNGGMAPEAIYETAIQSYLFLGFPRMIEAALAYNEVFGNIGNGDDIKPVSQEESQKWFDEGTDLCRNVYGRNYDRLRKKFLKMSPEVFRWMVIEGYGKVLSRPAMNHIERELAEVAALIVDGRRRQLISHLMGSLNMGATFNMLKTVLRDIEPLIGEANHRMTVELIDELERKYAADL
jgi:alkylhydroperoxidase/carboxymuconolactone decarboxylase family protein YurZ